MKLEIKNHIDYKFHDSFDYQLLTEGIFTIDTKYWTDYMSIYKR